MTLTIAPVDGQILKRDVLGRVKTPREHREAILKEFDQSGMSGQKFAKWAGIKYTTFANWLQQRRKQRQAPKGAQATEEVRWVEAVVGSRPRQKPGLKPVTVGLIVHGPGTVRMEIHEEKQVAWAAKLLQHLGVSGPC
jgi:transposase-like protein